MPRVRIPNASLIASADLPILPFLAPRVFADSPVSRRSKLQNGKSNGTQEAKKASSPSPRLNPSACRNGARDGQPTCSSSSYLRTAQQSPAAGLLRISHSTRNNAGVASQNRHVNHLYADISSFARQHARSHSTTAPAIRRLSGKARLAQQRPRSNPERPSSILIRHGPVLALKRQKALALERERLAKYISRLPSWFTESHRLRQGQYRSIHRRLHNLQYWDATHLDLGDIDGSSSNSSALLRAFAALDRALYPTLGRHTRVINISHDPKCVRWSANLFPPGTKNELHQVWTSWMAFDVPARKRSFQKLLLYLLDRKPARALHFIQVLADEPLLRGKKAVIIADALGHLSKIHSRGIYTKTKGWSSDVAANKQNFIPAFVHIFKKVLSSKPDICSQDLFYNIVGLATIEDLKKVFDCLVEARTRFGFDTLLHYANAFGEAGEVQYALRCLDELRIRHSDEAWQWVVDRERFRWSCALILRKSMSRSQNYHETPGIVAALVRLGVKMDILLYNVVMHNAMEAGDYTTAFKVYNALEGNGMKPDSATLSILLHGCTLQSNPAMFQEFAEHCAEVAKETKDTHLATDYLYYVYVRHGANPDTASTTTLLWQTYHRFFSAAPLEAFARRGSKTLRHIMEMRHVITESTLLEPPPVALYIMLQIEIRSALAMSDQRVLNLYQQFQQLATLETNSALTALARTPTIWNAFLLAFCKRHQFASASQLIKDMLDGLTQPNVYSWNIFMQAFFKTGQVQAADRVFEIMRSKGVDPDQYSYGILLRGYAKAQLIERIGDTMQHIETVEEMDPDLLRALAKVVNRKSLMLTLERSRLGKEAKVQAKAAADVEEERQRWAQPQSALILPFASCAPTPPTIEASNKSQVFEVQQFRGPVISKELPDIRREPQPDYQEPHEDSEDIFSFIPESSTMPSQSLVIRQELSRISHEQSRISPGTSETTRQRQEPSISLDSPISTQSDPYDPELQYRRLQEQLGIPTPTTGSGAQAPASETFDSFGANLGFKSMLPAKAENQPVISKGSSRDFKSMLPEDRIESATSKGPPKPNIRRVTGRPSAEKTGKH